MNLKKQFHVHFPWEFYLVMLRQNRRDWLKYLLWVVCIYKKLLIVLHNNFLFAQYSQRQTFIFQVETMGEGKCGWCLVLVLIIRWGRASAGHMEDWWDFNISSSQFEKRATETANAALFKRLWDFLFKVVTTKMILFWYKTTKCLDT